MSRKAHPTSRVTLSVRLLLSAAARPAVLGSLLGIEERTRAWPGCRQVEVNVSANDVDVVTLTQEWDSLAALDAHIRSADFRVVLAAIDRSSRPPEIRVDHVSESQDFGYLKHVLSSHE